ncbi:ribbon-helix-helix protein, CopG family [Mesorhizobium sp. M8A.F.Ca.ET.213.01.1.1]|nr:ribbon-helix-helix protein, CopG family [Mesorhizobium sp. M8A.F.Ca.ET.218.01.1.1]TGT14782.1 ribbon-helix-helix protein, CopG family [Mesorhizobium sp. M8A.F.Ca.ET.213.01.1.1]
MPVDKDKTVRTSMIVSSETYREVQELAVANDVSAAWIMRHALLEFLEAHRGESGLPLQASRRSEAPNGRATKKVR